MKFQYIILLIIGTVFTSCTDVIELELENPEPVFVVDGFLSDQDTIQWVRLSNLENYFAADIPDFTIYKNAKVYLLENSIIADTYSFNLNTNRFETQFKGIVGNEYQIDITLSDGTGYVSTAEIMESVTPIDSIWVTYNDNSSEGGPGFNDDIVVSINTHEPEGLGDNYQWKSYVNSNYNAGAGYLFFFDDSFVDGTFVNPMEVYSMSFEEFNAFKQGSPSGRVFVKIEQTQISLRYFKFLTVVAQQTAQSGTPFSAPASEIRGNVYKKGETDTQALGYFYTSSISSKRIEIIE